MKSRIKALRRAPTLDKVAFSCLCVAWTLMILVTSFLDIWIVGKVTVVMMYLVFFGISVDDVLRRLELISPVAKPRI